MRKNDEKEILKIKLLTISISAAAFILAASGFTLCKRKNDAAKRLPAAQETSSNYELAKEFWDKMPQNRNYMDETIAGQTSKPPYKPIDDTQYTVATDTKSNYEIAKEFWDEMPQNKDNSTDKSILGAPYKPISTGNQNSNDIPIPTMGPPYKPGTPDYSASVDQTFKNPIKDKIDEVNSGKIVENKTIPIPTMGPPYKPGTPDYSAMPIPRGTPILAEMYKIHPRLTKVDSNESKTPYMDEVRKNELYDMDPSLKPTVNPPYKPENENSENYSKGM